MASETRTPTDQHSSIEEARKFFVLHQVSYDFASRMVPLRAAAWRCFFVVLL